jgi:hypothetical protein
MKNFKPLAVVAFFGALACAGLHAQTVDVRATIPFDFRAGDALMPAGEYLIHEQDSWILLRAADGGKPARILMTIGVVGGDPKDARLDFKRYGSEYFLTELWVSSSLDGRQLLPTAREKELAKRGEVPARTAVTIASSK